MGEKNWPKHERLETSLCDRKQLLSHKLKTGSLRRLNGKTEGLLR